MTPIGFIKSPIRLMVRTLLLLTLLVGCSACRVFFWTFSSSAHLSHAELADAHLKKNEFDAAIAEYLAHIEVREHDPARPATENPYFYHLLIGDIFLKQNNVSKAKEHFIIARDHKVATDLIVDRIQQLDNWYASRGRYDEAIAVCEEFRSLDPFAFDGDIDRLHKLEVEHEDDAAPTSRSRPSIVQPSSPSKQR